MTVQPRSGVRWCHWVPPLLAVLYVVVLAVMLPALLHQAYRNSDAPMIPLIARAWHDGFGPAQLSSNPTMVPFAFDALLSPLSGWRQLVMASGPAMTVLTVVVMGLAARRVAGSGAAATTVAVAIAVSPAVLWPDLLQDSHVITVLGTAVLGRQLVLMARDDGKRGLVRAALTGIFSGLCLVSDQQIVVSGILPFCVALIWLRLMRRSDRMVVPAALVLGATAIIGVLLPVWMRSAGIETPPTFALNISSAGIIQGIGLTFRGLLWMVSGGWYGDHFGIAAVIGVPLLLGLVALPVVAFLRTSRELRRAPRGTSPAALLHVVFWSVSGIFLIGALLASGESHLDVQAHYIKGVMYSAAALIVVLVGPSAPKRLVVVATVMASALVVQSTAGLLRLDPVAVSGNLASPDDSAALEQIESHGLTRGYGDYWDAYDITWLSEGRIAVWPVIDDHNCTGEVIGSLCPYAAYTAAGEYRAQPGRTFLITHHRDIGCVTGPPDESVFGTPVDHVDSGDLTIYIYDHDIAKDFAGSRAPYCSIP